MSTILSFFTLFVLLAQNVQSNHQEEFSSDGVFTGKLKEAFKDLFPYKGCALQLEGEAKMIPVEKEDIEKVFSQTVTQPPQYAANYIYTYTNPGYVTGPVMYQNNNNWPIMAQPYSSSSYYRYPNMYIPVSQNPIFQYYPV